MTWDSYFMDIADAVSSNSKCASRKIGAVLVKNNRIISTGYNGPPSGISECWVRMPSISVLVSRNGTETVYQGYAVPSGTCPRKAVPFESGEGLEYCVASHAEVNAIVTASRAGVSVEGSTLYCSCPIPCKTCAGYIINAGVIEVVCKQLYEYDKYISSSKLFRDAGVLVRTAI